MTSITGTPSRGHQRRVRRGSIEHSSPSAGKHFPRGLSSGLPGLPEFERCTWVRFHERLHVAVPNQDTSDGRLCGRSTGSNQVVDSQTAPRVYSLDLKDMIFQAAPREAGKALVVFIVMWKDRIMDVHPDQGLHFRDPRRSIA